MKSSKLLPTYIFGLLILLIIIASWIQILTTDVIATGSFIWGCCIFLLFPVLLLFQKNWAPHFLILYLLVTTFNLFNFYSDKIRVSFGIRVSDDDFWVPHFDFRTMIILIIYLPFYYRFIKKSKLQKP
jgi:hypothetical protein